MFSAEHCAITCHMGTIVSDAGALGVAEHIFQGTRHLDGQPWVSGMTSFSFTWALQDQSVWDVIDLWQRKAIQQAPYTSFSCWQWAVCVEPWPTLLLGGENHSKGGIVWLWLGMADRGEWPVLGGFYRRDKVPGRAGTWETGDAEEEDLNPDEGRSRCRD